MPTHSKDVIPPSDYKSAENMIKQALADMESDSHIEYGTIVSKKKPNSLVRQWMRKFLSKIRNPGSGSNIVSQPNN